MRRVHGDEPGVTGAACEARILAKILYLACEGEMPCGFIPGRHARLSARNILSRGWRNAHGLTMSGVIVTEVVHRPAHILAFGDGRRPSIPR